MKFLKSVLALSSALLSLPALAGNSPVQPAIGEKACFVREYTTEHMRKNPKQILSTMYVLIEHTQVTMEDNETSELKSAKVVGTSSGKSFKNDHAICEYNDDGGIRCGLECDGGAIEVSPRQSEVLLRIASNYYFPLFADASPHETTSSRNSIILRASDRDNAIYKLYPAEVRKCEAAVARVKTRNSGC